MRMRIPKRIALVLGGGGLKGFAHIGVLRALEERGIEPVVVAGTSIGALIAAGRVSGMSAAEMEQRARDLKRKDLFRINHMGMLLDRMRSRSIYLEEPLRRLCESVAPSCPFDELPTRLLVNTVDIERGTQVVWGVRGMRDVPVSDAVYASCALPGFFPPGHVDGRVCVDGGVIDNLPVTIAALDMDAVIAVDVGSVDLSRIDNIADHGFATVFMRAATTMMHCLQQSPLEHWSGPPMILIRPRVGHLGWFSFARAGQLIAEGYRAAQEALAHMETAFRAAGGVYPRRRVRLAVDRPKCTGCGLCVSMQPALMGLDGERKAFPLNHIVEWSPADGDFINSCPTMAISAAPVVPVAQEQEEGRGEEGRRTA
jgi:NTE family protein